ncbi:hypothetical protein NM208_g9719 [Fusarium decemcellulare]|uniref:Uncharacterized protein n=1 Tax=Fusarium decemcellulare TaxID=57161 RepID=A0ACC1S107_9HYPO|nr:hypothetical protein NM208_g9719 [Fusarium decemcellulare]
MRAVSLLAPFSLAAAVAEPDPVLGPYQGVFQQVTIDWKNCTKDLEKVKEDNITIQCANFTVPLDYTSPQSNASVELQLLRVPAMRGSNNGSILFNFGGPGATGRDNLAQSASMYAASTGYVHDLIAFDPRGTGDTLRTYCMSNEENSVFTAKYPSSTNSSDVAMADTWVASKLLADACYENMKEFGKYLGTATFARDLISVVDALGEDGLLRYWGLSYGTIAGVTVAAMFPDRVGSLLLDGVVNAHEYYHGYEFEFLEKSDDAWSDFFKACIDNPSRCALARGNTTAALLEKDFYGYLWKLKHNPWVFENSAINFTTLKNTVSSALYDPAQWNSVSTSLRGLYEGNATAFIKQDKLTNGGDGTPNAVVAIRCSDKRPGAKSRSELFRIGAKKYRISKTLGDLDGMQDMACAHWRMPAKEVYKGNFHVKTRNPILFIGNTYDPVTPFISAKNMSVGFEGSVALEHHGYGHSSQAQPSACTIRAIRAYFNGGILPAPNSTCEPDVPLFSEALRRFVLGLGTQLIVQLSGINATSYYLPTVLIESVGLEEKLARLLTAVNPVHYIFFSYLGMMLIDKWAAVKGTAWPYNTDINSMAMRMEGASARVAAQWTVNYMVVQNTPKALDIDILFEEGLYTCVFLDKQATQVARPSRFVAMEEQEVEQAAHDIKAISTEVKQTEHVEAHGKN